MIVEDLKKSILNYAVTGNLTKRMDLDSDVDDMLNTIENQKNNLNKTDILIGSKVKRIEDKIFEIPKEWQFVRIGKIAKIISKGTTPKGGKNAYKRDGIKFVRAENVNKNIIFNSDIKYIDEDTHNKELKRSILCKDDILICIAGTLGRCAVVKESDLPLNTNQAVAFIRLVDPELIDPWYMYYVLSSDLIQKQLIDQKKITAIPNLTLEIITNCIIPIPSIEEQRRIIKKIEELFKKLDEVTPIERELSELKNNFGNSMINAIYQSAMSGMLTQQHPEEQSKDFLELLKKEQNKYEFKKMKDIKSVGDDVPYELPSNWTWERIGNIYEINLGFTYRPTYVEDGYKFLSVKDISSGSIDFNNVKYISKEEYEKASYGSKPLKGDILFGRVGTIGVPQIVETDEPFCIFVSLGFLRDFTNLMNKKYVCYWMKSSLFKKQVAENVSGTAQINLNTNWLKNFYIPIPPIEEQQRIVDIIERILPLCEDIEELVIK